MRGNNEREHMATVAVKERPILFSGEMVRAILDGRKTQTRRVCAEILGNYVPNEGLDTAPDVATYDKGFGAYWSEQTRVDDVRHMFLKCPYGKPGDRLWIKTGYRTRY